MSLLYMEGWDSLNALSDKYNCSPNSTVLETTAGRFGGKCLKVSHGYGNNGWLQLPGFNKTTFFIGATIKISTIYAGSTNIIGFTDASGTYHCVVLLSATGQLGFGNNTNILLGSFSTNTLTAGVWYFVEMKVTISDSVITNDCIIKVDGVEWVNLASGDTKYSTQTTVNSVEIRYTTIDASKYLYIDDLYILDESGSTCNTFLGDCRIDYLSPDGNGTTNNFVGSDADSTDNYLLIDELIPDTADYVESATPDNVDLYSLANLGSVPSTVHAIQVENKAAKDSVGQRTYANLIRSGGTNYAGGTKSVGYPDYTFNRDIWEVNPNGGAAWNAAALDGLEIGVKIIA